MKQLSIILLFAALFLSFVSSVGAASCEQETDKPATCVSDTTAVPLTVPPKIPGSTHKCVCPVMYVCTALGCIDPKPENFVGWLLSNAIKVAGALAFLLMLLGTVKIITSGGNPEAIGEGKEIITSAVTGLLIIIFAAVILRFIGVDILKIPGFL